MGIDFIVIMENRAKRSQEAISREFGVDTFTTPKGKTYVDPRWRCFSYQGKDYVTWTFPPRYFDIKANPEEWEALRKYLVRVRTFLGNGQVYLGNDVVWAPYPSDDRPFALPLPLSEEVLAEPDPETHPELANIKELEDLTY